MKTNTRTAPVCAKIAVMPCPFCGLTPKFRHNRPSPPEIEKPFWSLGCPGKKSNCVASPMVFGDSRAEALCNWNRRDTGRPGESDFRDAEGRTFQPIIADPTGDHRFKKNAIVRFLLDNGGFDLNALAYMEFTDADRAQFAQLIGYSVNGYGELNYVPLAEAHVSDAISDNLTAVAERREKGGAS